MDLRCRIGGLDRRSESRATEGENTARQVMTREGDWNFGELGKAISRIVGSVHNLTMLALVSIPPKAVVV